MLASITPLGERGRGFSWNVTATAFAVGAVGAGALGGAALGALGSLLPGGAEWRTVALAAVLSVAVLFDTTPLRGRLPTTRRQVNEDWLHRFRGWVYGISFGAQLGVGLATIVSSAAVYATVASALLCANPLAGAAIGGSFGLIRALSLLFARNVRDPRALLALHRRFTRLEPGVQRIAVAGELIALIAVIGVLA
jgi:MFS family permease